MIRVDIINDGTGTEEIGNYTYRIYTPFTRLAEGKLSGHKRKDGWESLLEKVVDFIKNNEQKI